MVLRKTPTGTWMPAWVPESTFTVSVLLVFCSAAQSITTGYDGSMLNGLNILPSYTDYFELDTVTLALQTVAVYMGGAAAPLITGYLLDRLGRRMTLFWATNIMLVGVVLQTCAQNIAMFVISRLILGFGNSISGAAGAVYLSETFKPSWRTWGVGLYNDFYYVGGFIAAGITLGTAQWEGTWAWRLPSLIQGVFSLACLAVIPFLPESPRWLAYRGLEEDARRSIAQTNANGNPDDLVVFTVYKEVTDQLEWEKKEGKTTSWTQLFKGAVNRKRMLIAMTPAVFSVVAGYPSTYYLGTELNAAGVTDPIAQLEVNLALQAFAFVCCLCGTQLCARWGRYPTGVLTQALCAITMLLIGVLTVVYGESDYLPGIYANVACMFLFVGSYSIGWTPLLFLYPPEVLNYSLRANGMALAQFMNNAVAVMFLYVMPIALENIGWKIYFINVGWDVVILVIMIFYWVETKGKTLEEIDEIFEGTKHSEVPNLEEVKAGETDALATVQHLLDEKTDHEQSEGGDRAEKA